MPMDRNITSLIRECPRPIPAIYPVPEYLVEGDRRRQYQEMKRAIQVPWMGVVTMAYAHYPHFFSALWEGLKPIVVSSAFVDQGKALRQTLEHEVRILEPRNINEDLRSMGYAPRELAQILDMLEIFSHGNFPYLLIATITRLLLEGHDMAPSQTVSASVLTGHHAPTAAVPLVLMEAHHATEATRLLYEDIKETLRLPFVNTDYRALARWPSYFSAAWMELKPAIQSDHYSRIGQMIHERTVALAQTQLPNPGSLRAAALIQAAKMDAPLEEVIQMARLFQWLLPGLVINVAYLRAQLIGDIGTCR